MVNDDTLDGLELDDEDGLNDLDDEVPLTENDVLKVDDSYDPYVHSVYCNSDEGDYFD